MSRGVSFFLGILLLAISLPAFAGADGPTLINQSVVLKAGGFPYVITQPGSYQLTGNLVVPADTNGIVINTNNVTLDLNGFTISGAINCNNGTTACAPQPTVFNVAGINANGTLTSIRNGHVRGFAYGVRVSGGIVEDLRVSENWYVGINANNAVLRHNTASINNQVGIQAFNCLTIENTILDNGTKQILAAGGGVFSHNIIRWYLENGIEVTQTVVNEHNSSCIYSGNDGAC